MRPNSFAVIAAGLFVCIAGSAWAQTGAGDSVHGGPVNQSSSNGPSDGDNGPDVRAPVLRITSVEVIRSSHGPTLDIIRVRGLASSRGWEEARQTIRRQGRGRAHRKIRFGGDQGGAITANVADNQALRRNTYGQLQSEPAGQRWRAGRLEV
jgi:hypothetical protein